MKSYRLIGLLLLIWAISSVNPTYSLQDISADVSFFTSIPGTKAHATIYASDGTPIRFLTIPETVSLQTGQYSVRFELAGYQNETKSFDVSDTDLDIEFNLKKDQNWHQVVDLKDRFYRFVGFQETNGTYVTLIDAIPREQFYTYLSDEGTIDITHFVYSHDSQFLRTVEMFDEFSSVMQTASKLDERHNWHYSDLRGHLKSR